MPSSKRFLLIGLALHCHCRDGSVDQAQDRRPTFVEEDNHASPFACSVPLFHWWRKKFKDGAHPRVLDVGGGRGDIGAELSRRFGTLSLSYECVDVVPSSKCRAFDGSSLNYSSASADVVLFNYVLHHAADNTISLLTDARRIARKFVIVVEDIKAKTRSGAMGQFLHEWSGTYRGDVEWGALFDLVGLRIQSVYTPSYYCADEAARKLSNDANAKGLQSDRKMYVLTHRSSDGNAKALSMHERKPFDASRG